MDERLKIVFETEYSENKLSDFHIKTQKIYEIFGYEFILKPSVTKPTPRKGGIVWVNEEYSNSPISNLEIVNINYPYPMMISKLAETNLEKFNEMYAKLIEINITENNTNLKKYINTAYGCLSNPDSVIYCRNVNLVTARLNTIIKSIISEFKGHVVYASICDIHFRNFDEIRERFMSYFNKINKYELTYFLEKSKFGFYSAKLKYMIEQNGNIKIKAMRHFHKNGVSRGGFIEL